MTETISADAVKIAGALIAQIDEQSSAFLTEEQQRTFRSLQDVKDTEAKSAKTMEIMDQLITDAKAALESDPEVKQASESVAGQFSPEAMQEVRNSAAEFEGRIRSEAQAEMRSLTAKKKSNGAPKHRMRI